MTSDWRTIRVFISSTFRDMHAERDYLVKRVFPALRERLEKYRIYLDDIDLRWGVTEDQLKNALVLPYHIDIVPTELPKTVITNNIVESNVLETAFNNRTELMEAQDEIEKSRRIT